MFGQRHQKLNFCEIQELVFLKSYVIMPGGRLWEMQKQKTKSNIWFTKWSRSLRNLSSGGLRESF